MAKIGAAVFEIESSHVPMLSNPRRVDVIRMAAETAHASPVA